MSRKLSLDPDALSVESFQTGEGVPPAGTVEARQAQCTSPATCRCPSSLFACGDFPETAYSCPPTS